MQLHEARKYMWPNLHIWPTVPANAWEIWVLSMWAHIHGKLDQKPKQWQCRWHGLLRPCLRHFKATISCILLIHVTGFLEIPDSTSDRKRDKVTVNTGKQPGKVEMWDAVCNPLPLLRTKYPRHYHPGWQNCASCRQRQAHSGTKLQRLNVPIILSAFSE